MKNRKIIVSLSVLLIFLLSLTACGQTGNQPQDAVGSASPQKTVEASLTVSAAASLKDALEEIKEIYSQEKPDIAITYNFDSSGSLQQQIEQGADVDVFISAASKQMDELDKKGLIDESSRKDILKNSVVLVIPKGSTGVTDFKDLAEDTVKKVALGEPKSVPAGQYAEEVLTKFGILEKVKPKSVYGKDVKAVLTWVETGDADAGIVYETDAKISEKVKIAAKAPEDSHKPVVYPAAIIKASKNQDASGEYMSFLSGDKAKAIFEKYGFTFIAK